jgi:acetyl esterase
MNLKQKLILLVSKLNPPLGDNDDIDITKRRKQAYVFSKLGFLLFDKKVKIYSKEDSKIDDIPIRIYKNSDKPNQPVMLYYHGGGFVMYGLDSHDNVCKRLCHMNNCIVVAVDYRLAPEYTFPAAHDDAFKSIIWAKENIARYGGNPDKIIVAGDSAGGNLSACMAHRCKDEGIHLCAQILIYPWTDGRIDSPSVHKNGHGYMLTYDNLLWFQRHYTPNPKDKCNPKVSPLFEVDFSNLAPAFIATATYDPLLDDGFLYYEKLRDAGNAVTYIEYKALIHGFFNIPYLDGEAMKAYYDIQKFLSKVL